MQGQIEDARNVAHYHGDCQRMFPEGFEWKGKSAGSKELEARRKGISKYYGCLHGLARD